MENFLNKKTVFEEMIIFDCKLSYNGKKYIKNIKTKGWTNLHKSTCRIQDVDNFCVLTGKKNGIVVVDIDNKEGTDYFDVQNNKELMEFFKEQNTLVTRSANGGLHLFFKYSNYFLNANYPGLDLLSDGKCVTQGKHYEVIYDNKINEMKREFLSFLNYNYPKCLNLKLYKGEPLIVPDGVKGEVENDVSSILNRVLECNDVWEQTTNNKYTYLNKSRPKYCFVCKKDHFHPGQCHIVVTKKNVKVKCKSGDEFVIDLKPERSNDPINEKAFLDWFVDYLEKKEIKLLNLSGVLYCWKKENVIWKEFKNIYDELNNKDFVDFCSNLIPLNVNENIDAVYKVKSYLGRNGFQKNMVDMLTRLNIKTDIVFNDNGYLIAFDNGVYDFKHHCFRECVPEDYVSKTVGYNYNASEEKEKARSFIYELFMDRDTAEYFIKILATCLIDVPHRSFYILKGAGSNGKSKILNAVQMMLGNDLSCNVKNVLVGESVEGEKASPELSKCKNKRVVITTEPESGRKFNCDLIKSFTGGDRISSRKLFKESEDWFAGFTILISINNIVEFDDLSYGFRSRINVVPFEYIFKSDPNPNQPREKREMPVDDLINSLEFKQSLFNLLCDYANQWVNEGCLKITDIPEKVRFETNNYLETGNSWNDFVINNIDVTYNEDDYISPCELKEAFTEYTDTKPEKGFNQMFLNCAKGVVYKDKRFGFGIRKKVFVGCKFVDKKDECEL